MTKLWDKGQKVNSAVEAYTTSGYQYDQQLVVWDSYASIAHAIMLHKIKLLSGNELSKLRRGLLQIIKLSEQNKFSIDRSQEDCHTAIENFLTQKYGSVGQKIHTGRSRNDQVLVATRLYMKAKTFEVAKVLTDLINALLSLGIKYEYSPMPGFTHMQKAMPSSVGMWAGAFAESLLDNFILLEAAYQLIDQSPLGAAAGYGVPIQLDRKLTAKLLGFAKIQNNSLYCINSRGKQELALTQVLTHIMLDLSRLAQDLLIFTTEEYQYFKINGAMATGSSIMPQKKNLDVAELLKAKTHKVKHYSELIADILISMPSGYNSDMQETKPCLIEAINLSMQSIQIAKILIQNTSPNQSVLQKACEPKLYATHQVYQLVSQGMPFRKAYKQVAKKQDYLSIDPVKTLKQSQHLGGTGKLNLKQSMDGLKLKSQQWDKKADKFYNTLTRLRRSI